MNETHRNQLKLDLISRILQLSDLNDLKRIKATLEEAPESYLDSRLLTVEEAATYMGGVSKVTMYRYNKKGLKSVMVFGRRFYRKSMLDEYIDSCQENGTDE